LERSIESYALPSSERPVLLGPEITATESYAPSLSAPPLRVWFEPTFPLTQHISVRDLVFVRSIFSRDKIEAMNYYAVIVDELMRYNAKVIPLHKGCHKGTTYESTYFHEMDSWKDSCPTLSLVAKAIAEGFQMNVDACRINWYENQDEWKPFHHDAHAFADSPRGTTRSVTRNFSALVSFGSTRQYALQDPKCKLPSGTLSIDMPNGSVIGLARDTNILWRHGVLKGVRNGHVNGPRISIVLNGWVHQQEEADNNTVE